MKGIAAMKLATSLMLLSIVFASRVTAQSGCTATDSSANHHDGTFVGNPPPECVDGISGTALSFNGQNYVEIPNSTDFNLTELTLEAWIRSSNTQFGSVVSTADDNFGACGTTLYNLTGYEFDQRITADVAIRCGTGGEVISLNALNDNQWHHLAMTLGGGFLKYYVDGALQGTTATSIQPTNTLAPLRIGFQNTHGGRYWHGLIDEVRLSKVIRYTANFTPQQSYAADSNTVGYWKFDTQSEQQACSAADISPNHRDGTFVGNPPPECVEGISGAALEFDGTQNFVSISNDAAYYPQSAFTLETWFRTSGRGGVILGNSSSTEGYVMGINSDLRFPVFNAI